MRRDYYAVLGITSTAVPREIRQAYRRLARQYSPDVNFWDDRARGLYEEIAEAYRILSDPGARAMYDQFGGGGALGPGRRGEDLHVTVDLKFREVAQGATVTTVVGRFTACAACEATGVFEGRRCELCTGRGVRRHREALSLSLPAGVDSGSQVRVVGEGHAGPFGGPRGDLIVSTRVEEHPFFVRKGENVHCEVPVSVWEALRGGRLRIPTPTGATVLVLPQGTVPGQVFRLRGVGLPRMTQEGAGDLLVSVRVELPQGLDPHTDELVRELERLSPLYPRQDLTRYEGGTE